MRIDFSNPALVRIRSVTRATGALRPIVRLYRRLFQTGYEQNFDQQMLDLIRPGDVVWDVGANKGIYTEKILKKVTGSDFVAAFEP